MCEANVTTSTINAPADCELCTVAGERRLRSTESRQHGTSPQAGIAGRHRRSTNRPHLSIEEMECISPIHRFVPPYECAGVVSHAAQSLNQQEIGTMNFGETELRRLEPLDSPAPGD